MRDEGGLVDDRGLLPGELVTGEAVLLDLRPASFATRMLAVALDALAQVVLLVGLFWAAALAGVGLDDAAVQATAVVVTVVVLVGWPVAWETLTRGRSLGKLAGGLRVVRDDGGPVRFRHALVRGLVGVGELWMTAGGPAVITSLANARGKRLGDLLAGTYVVRERTAAHRPPPVDVPAHLAAWVHGADVARLPDDLALAARQLLGRADRLHPGARAQLGAELASRVGRYVAPPPPVGTSAEELLAAVLGERRRREHERLVRERVARDAGQRVVHDLPYGLGR
ncbi:RDD family protein [Thalassiella azotivora]